MVISITKSLRKFLNGSYLLAVVCSTKTTQLQSKDILGNNEELVNTSHGLGRQKAFSVGTWGSDLSNKGSTWSTCGQALPSL